MGQIVNLTNAEETITQLENQVKSQQAELEKIHREYLLELQYLRHAIDNLPGSIYWKDKNGIYLGQNKYASEKMRSAGLEGNSFVGKTDYDLFAKEIADSFRTHDLEVLTKKIALTLEESTVLEDGSALTQLSTKRPMYDYDGNIIGIIGSTVDITHLKEIENELRVAKEKAEQADKYKSEFIKNMEHDIRTPLTGIYSLAQILAETEENLQRKEDLLDLVNAAKQMHHYCNNILAFSKLENSRQPVAFEKFNLKHLIRSIIAMEIPAIKHKNLFIHLNYSNFLPEAFIGDENRIQRLLINLVSNAVKFTETGGIEILVTPVKTVNEENILLNVAIKDTGIGIPQDKLDYIYEKFAKLSASPASIYKGTGLGLAVVKHLLEEMGGKIRVESTPDAGSTFICTLLFKTV